MKKLREASGKAVIAFIMLILITSLSAQTLRIATYNIRYDTPNDSLDLWKNRHPYIAGLIKLYDIELFGTQEGLKHQLDDLKGKLDGFEYIGVGRDDGDKKGEFTAIFYLTSKFIHLESGNFWLSNVTNKPNKGWDAALPRICTWVKFREIASGKELFMFNTHFDHMGQKARMESARLVIAKAREIAGTNPVILTGDFNFDEKHPNYQIIKNSGFLNDAYDVANFSYAPGGTFTGFDITAKPEGRIDHIFITDDFKVRKYAILTNTYQGHYPSDHFAIFSEIFFTNN
jgi:endonuclease/exonuclease/phosphatase family metal-dependent hydrolase